MNNSLAVVEACIVVKLFLEKFYEGTTLPGIALMLNDLQGVDGNGIVSPHVWNRWLHSVDTILNERKEELPRNELSTLESFEAMRLFLEEYYHDTFGVHDPVISEIHDDIAGLLGEIQFFEDGGTYDPAAWKIWNECVSKVLEEKK
jgi:hypothetical protein